MIYPEWYVLTSMFFLAADSNNGSPKSRSEQEKLGQKKRGREKGRFQREKNGKPRL